MVWSAARELLALDFAAGRRGQVPRHERQYLLWPALAYRVTAPEPRPRDLDVFQRAILGLCRASAHDVATLARRLHLDGELVRFIRGELIARAWLDERGQLTAEGLARLHSDGDVSLDRMITGYVFLDPFSETLWPRFTETLQPTTLEYGDGKFPEVLLGTSGSPFRARPFVVEHPNSTPATPRPAEILRALAAHGAAHRRRSDEPGQIDLDDLPPPPPVAERRVSFIEEDPLLCHLLTYAAVAPDDLDWAVRDPFGLGDSPRFKERLAARAAQFPALHERLRQLDDRARKARLGDHADRRADLRAAAERRLADCRWPGRTGDHLLELTICVVEAELLGAHARDEHHRLGDHAAQYGRKTLEALFSWLAERHPLRDVWQPLAARPSDDTEYIVGYVTRAARAIGLAEPLPEPLLRVRPNQIRAASYPDGGWSLRPRIVATILAAQRDLHHPLRTAAARQPRLCAELDILAALCSQELHDRRGPPRTPQPEQLAQRITAILDLFPA